jgi:hypothetical protein
MRDVGLSGSPQTGGCQCGAIRYEITEAPHLVYTCHCTECQRLTGSAFSMALVVAGAAFQLAGTQPRPLQRKADSGRTVTGGSARIAAHGSAAAQSPSRLHETRFASATSSKDPRRSE